MANLDSWVSQVEESIAVLGPVPGLGNVKVCNRPLLREVAMSGFPGVLPLWTGRRLIIGLRVDPCIGAQSWAGIILNGGQGGTVSSAAPTLLPQIFVQEALSNLPDTAQRMAERWDDIAEKMLALHTLLGGAADTLDAVVSVIRDPEARSAFKYKETEATAFEEAHSQLCRRIDASAQYVRYANWIDACVAGRYVVPDDPVQYGVWGRRVLCLASRLSFAGGPIAELPDTLLHQLLEGNAGIDSGVPSKPSWDARVGGSSGETTLVEAANSMRQQQESNDPVNAGILTALRTEGTSYRGLAHAEAAAALDERGEPERAWEALQSAAWWSARNTGKVPPSMLTAARFIANRHDWADASWVLERYEAESRS